MRLFENRACSFLWLLLVAGSLLLGGCGGGEAAAGGTPADLSSGVSPAFSGKGFGLPGASEAVAAAAQRQSTYFDGRHANTPQGLIGSKVAPNGAAWLSKDSVKSTSVAQPVYRFFNTATGVHFYTVSEDEKIHVLANYPIFQHEGAAFLAFPNADPALSPVYRFYNRVSGTHFYTINATEKDHVIATWPDIFSYEGVAWYASVVGGESWVPIYRFFNTKTGTHFYTANESEKEKIIATIPLLRFEGVGYYVKLPATAPGPIQMNVERAVVKTDVLNNAQSFLVQLTEAGYFRSAAGRNWTVGQVFLFNGIGFKVSGFVINADGSTDISTNRIPLSEAYSDLKFTFKTNSLVYDDNLNPMSAAQLAAKRGKVSPSGVKINKVPRKDAITGLHCLIPKQTSSGTVTASADLEWGYTFELNNCSLNDLLQLDGSFPPGGVNLNGSMKITSVTTHEYDLANSTNLTTSSSSASIDVTVSGSLSQLARNQLRARKSLCQEVNGVLECGKQWDVGAPRTVFVGAIPITIKSGFGIKFSVDIDGSIVFKGTSGYQVVEGTLNGRSVSERNPTASSFYTPKVGLSADAEVDFFGYGFIEAGIGVEALNVEGYLAKLSTQGGVYGTAAVKSAVPVCAVFSGGLRVAGEIEALKLGSYYLAKIEEEWNLELASGALPSGCDAKGRVKLNYVIAGKDYYTPNYTAYEADVPVDVYDASMDFFLATTNGRLKQIDLSGSIPTKKGRQISYEFEMLAGNTSTAKLVNYAQVGGDSPYTRVFIDPGNTTYGDVIKFKIIAYEADDRVSTESVRRVEIRFEPALAANPEFQTVVSTSGQEQYFVLYNYGGATASMIQSGYLKLQDASALNFSAPSYGDIRSFHELSINNADQRASMRPAQLALLGKHDRAGNEKLFNVVERTDVVIDSLAMSPSTPKVGDLVTLTVRGERLPAALAVMIPNCSGLQELRSAGNIARNNYATGERVYECTANAAGTNLIARVGPANTPLVFSIDPPTSCPPGQALQNGACVPVPTITNVSPLTAVLSESTVFTVTGLNLPLTAIMAIADADCQTPVNRTANGFQQTCTPLGTTGSKSVTIKTHTAANGGVVIDNSRSVTVTATAVSSGTLPHTGITSSQCFAAGSSALVSCSSAGALALSGAGKQDGMYASIRPMSYSQVPYLGFPGQFYSKNACVKDNVTGLIWEGKTGDNGLRDYRKTYTNYGDGRAGDASAYVTWINQNDPCPVVGYGPWRLPTVDELETLVDAGKGVSPTIDTNWFVQTATGGYWTASPLVGNASSAWYVGFGNGYVYSGSRNGTGAVRLVRASQ